MTEATHAPRRTRAVLAHVFPPAIIAAVALLLGAPDVVLVVLAASVVLILLRVVAPGAARTFDRAVARAAERIGLLVGQVLLSIVWVVFVLPVGALGAVLRRLRRQPVLSAPGWQRATTDAPSGSEMTFSPPLGGSKAGSPLTRIASLLVAALLGVVAAVQFWPEQTVERVPGPPVVFRPQVYAPEDLAATVAYAFADEPWAEQALLDTGKTSAIPDPIRGWRIRDLSSRYVNVVDGRRVSYEPKDPTVTIWFFGGSTTFGDGQRDEHTIPSEIARLAERSGIRIRTVNFGVGSYNNLQGTLAFLDALSVEPPPDVAVFYDGANEWASARERVNYGELDPERPYFQAISDEERTERAARATASVLSAEQQDELVVRLGSAQYRRGADLARWAGAANGVEVVHVWQPGLWSTPVRPFTRPLLDAFGVDEPMVTQAGAVMTEMKVRSGVEPVDLGDALAEVDRPTFFDFEHTNELGARVIAERLYEHLLPLILRS